MSRVQRRKYILLLLLFLLFIIEGTIIPWLIPGFLQNRIAPHLVYVVILFVTVYYDRHTALILGFSFGMLHDIVYYGALIGTYSLAMGCSCYILGLIFRSHRAPMPLMLIVTLLGSLLFDSIVYGVYLVFEITHLPFSWALSNHIIPTMFFHFAFALMIYVPLRRQLEIIAKRRSLDENKTRT
ncbi:rod shape-determining protein MreD [Paenibacillus turicensis]|uniref:rod shape-determining protein MreD n=1 Tax=Paenibacillus turicensis TaxID=160487 RepID=UPI003D28219E